MRKALIGMKQIMLTASTPHLHRQSVTFHWTLTTGQCLLTTQPSTPPSSNRNFISNSLFPHRSYQALQVTPTVTADQTNGVLLASCLARWPLFKISFFRTGLVFWT